MSTHIPFDIQVQIIERLPIKSLIRFRSVCKAWKSLIDCSEFIATYSFHHTQSQHLMIRYTVAYGEENEVKYVCFVDDDNNTFPQQKFALTVPPLVQLTIPIGSSHGLLCLSGYFGEPDDSCPTSRTKIAVLWNPAIRKSIAVVVPDNVVFGPFDYVIGFGVCPNSKDPKVVKITYIYDYRKMESISCIPGQVMVFTLSSGGWTCLRSNQLPRKSIIFTSSQTVIGQFIYWLACDWIVVDNEFRNLIMSFDLSTEEFREVDLPKSLTDEDPETCLFISRLKDSLVVVEYDADFSWKRAFVVWMMEHGDPKSFTKLFTIEPPHAASITPQIMGFRKSGEPILEIWEVDRDCYTSCPLVVYEPFSGHIKHLGIWGKSSSFYGSFYTESLLLLDQDDGCIVSYGAVKR